jgi:K+-sensing histidine kinase KdpD
MAATADPGRRRARWSGANATPRASPDPPRRILLASPGVPFGRDVLARTIELAAPERATITVLSIARVYGTALGLPHPGLQPTRLEWDEQRKIVDDASMALRRRGFDVRAQVTKSRNAAKMIARWGTARNFHAIVVPDPERPRWRRAVEGDLAGEILRRCGIPVHPVPVASPSHRAARAT